MKNNRIDLLVMSLLIAVVMVGPVSAAIAASTEAATGNQQQAKKNADDSDAMAQMKKKAEDAKKMIIARVNGAEISMYSLVRTMNRVAGRYVKPGEEITPETTKKIKKAALDRLVFEELAAQEAVRQGINPKPEAVDQVVNNVKKAYGSEEGYQKYLDQYGFTGETFRKQIERGHRLELITAREIYGKVEVSQKELKKTYKKEKKSGRLRKGDEYIVKDVLLMKGDSEEATRKRAEELLAQIKKNDKDLGKLILDGTFIVRRLKVDKEKYPTIYKTMHKMKVGKLSKVIKDRDSFHIIKVVKKDKARDLTLDEAKGFLENRLRMPAQDARRAAWEKELLKNAKVEILLDKVEEEFKKQAFTAKRKVTP